MNYSIVQVLNSAAETVNCRQFISCVLIAEMISHKTVYNDSSKFFLLLVCSLQEMNAHVKNQKAIIKKNKHCHHTEDFK